VTPVAPTLYRSLAPSPCSRVHGPRQRRRLLLQHGVRRERVGDRGDPRLRSL